MNNTMLRGNPVQTSLCALLIQAGSYRRTGESAIAVVEFPTQWRTIRMAAPIDGDSLTAHRPDVIFVRAIDRPLALGTVRRVSALTQTIPIVLLVDEGNEEFAIEAFHAGVRRYLKEPWNAARVRAIVSELLPVPMDSEIESRRAAETGSSGSLVGPSASMSDLRQCIEQVAPSDSNVLITGETGTGKELVAQLLHARSRRRRRSFVCLNTTAIPESLIESELFGYERGAFTGAQGLHEGKLASANGGTVFFDEIGDTSPGVQAKLLRAIESRQIYRLGSTRSQDLDIRVLAATNQDLEIAAREHRFRSDLYYRLNVVRVEIPPLRDRMEDLPTLVWHYIQRFNLMFGTRVTGLAPGAMDQLMSYPWPGNVRELRNALEVVFVHLPHHAEGVVDLPAQVIRLIGRAMKPHEVERVKLLRALAATQWNKTEAAKSLHWSRMTLYRKLLRHRISPT